MSYEKIQPRPTPPVALSIAGFDPSSGAGVTADLKTFAAHRVYGVACIGALTVQSTQGVRRVEPVARELIRETLACLAEDLPLAGVKIGMLGGAGTAAETARFLRQGAVARERAVLDPVLVSSSGAALLDTGGLEILRGELLASVGWATPNLRELAVLTGTGEIGRGGVSAAARRLREMAAGAGNGGLNVVVTGGHLEPPDDFLLTGSGEEAWIPGQRVDTAATHGTGCAFSSALLCRLIAGDGPVEAVTRAKAYVAGAMRAAYPVGKGKGPMHHLFPLE